MPPIVWSEEARRDLIRLHDFIAEKNRDAARRAAGAIRAGITAMREFPLAGRGVEGVPGVVRERMISFGGSSYVVRYSVNTKRIFVVSIRHGREASYGVGPPFDG